MYVVQVGKGKGSYSNRYTFPLDESSQAAFHYRCINIGNGYKKRLIDTSTNKVLAREAS